jgi:DNA-binding protein HU-beta
VLGFSTRLSATDAVGCCARKCSLALHCARIDSVGARFRRVFTFFSLASAQCACYRSGRRRALVSASGHRRSAMAGKRLTKSQVIAELAELTELDKKSINRVFDGLTEIIKKQLGSRGPGEFVVPGLLKLKAVKKPATKDRPGINPFTKQPITIKGKPASKKIRASALKALKDLIQ